VDEDSITVLRKLVILLVNFIVEIAGPISRESKAFQACAAALIQNRQLTNPAAQSSAYMSILRQGNCPFLLSFRHFAGTFPPCEEEIIPKPALTHCCT